MIDLTWKEKLNVYYQEATEAMENKDYELAEEKYHLLSHLSRVLYNDSENSGDRGEYLSLAKEYANKESYARTMKEGMKTFSGWESERSFSDFIGEEKTKEYIRMDVIEPWKKNNMKSRKLNGILIYGPYGVGKTILVKALANELGATIYTLSPLMDFSNDNYPDAINSVSRVIKAAVANDNSIIFLEDPLCYFPKGEENCVSADISELFLDYFKKEMRRIKKKNKKVLFVMTTNCPDKLDERVVNEKIFDDLICISLPDEETRKQLIKRKHPELDDKLINEFAAMTSGYTSWQITKLCSELNKDDITEDDIHALVKSHDREYDSGYFDNVDSFLQRLI